MPESLCAWCTVPTGEVLPAEVQPVVHHDPAAVSAPRLRASSHRLQYVHALCRLRASLLIDFSTYMLFAAFALLCSSASVRTCSLPPSRFFAHRLQYVHALSRLRASSPLIGGILLNSYFALHELLLQCMCWFH